MFLTLNILFLHLDNPGVVVGRRVIAPTTAIAAIATPVLLPIVFIGTSCRFASSRRLTINFFLIRVVIMRCTSELSCGIALGLK
jgi:hypothetical protein